MDIKELFNRSVAPPATESGFNRGSKCDGEWQFRTAIEQDAVEVGAIPEEKHQVRIELSRIAM